MKLSTIRTEDFYINIFDVSLSSTTLCIVGGVHGNEPCGVKAISQINCQILKDPISIKSRVITIIANCKAIEYNKRFIDWDLNRAFGKSNGFGHEKCLAQQLIPYLKDVDYLVDLHSTSAPTKPFCAGKLSEKHLNLFSATGITIYTHGWGLHRKYNMLIDEVDRLGGIGVIVECGQNNSTQANQVAYNVVKNVMSNIVMDKPITYLPLSPKMIIKIEKIIKAKTNQFSFVRNFHNFSHILSNETIGYDNKIPIRFSNSFIMVMPNHGKLKSGDEVFARGVMT
jgi:succinylglutamate desuccinylase